MNALVFEVDLRKYRPGICVGDEKIIVECPACKRGSYRERYSGGFRYVHTGTLSNGATGLKWKRKYMCRIPCAWGVCE